jgi:hypothetical protein
MQQYFKVQLSLGVVEGIAQCIVLRMFDMLRCDCVQTESLLV